MANQNHEKYDSVDLAANADMKNESATARLKQHMATLHSVLLRE